MATDSRQAELLEEFDNLNWDVVGLSGVRIKKEGGGVEVTSKRRNNG